MKTLTVIVTISLLLVISATAFGAGTMQFDTDKQIGMTYVESLIRAAHFYGQGSGLSQEDYQVVKEALSKLFDTAYEMGTRGEDIEPAVEVNLRSFEQAFDKAFNEAVQGY